MSRLVTRAASSTVMPITISVRMDELAMALAQPKVLNLASRILCVFSSILRKILRASPQVMLPTSASASASAISPTFRGFRK